MDFAYLIFWAFAIVLVGSSLLVITVRNPVHAAFFLVLSFFTAAALWLLLYAEFLALALIIVYVGAVMVLFLFVVMMLDINLDVLREGFWRQLPLAGAVGALMALEMIMVLASREFGLELAPSPGAPPAGFSNTKALGQVIYTDYVFPFEIAAVILLVAIIAAIAVTLRQRKETKYQDPRTQLAVTKASRLKIVKMAPQTPPKPEAAE
jgi:NADH-quinone oxidoreductase subunit J